MGPAWPWYKLIHISQERAEDTGTIPIQNGPYPLLPLRLPATKRFGLFQFLRQKDRLARDLVTFLR